MSEFLMLGRHFSVNHVWFETAQNFPFRNHYDILIIHGNLEPCDKLGKNRCKTELQRTCISDLTKSEEELFHLMSSSTRGHINRCIRKDVMISAYCHEADILTVLDNFSETYHGMFLEKGIPDKFLPLEELKAYAHSNSLLITTAEIDGQPVQYHAYITDKTHSRLLYSCSRFRSANDELRRLTGWANDYLHWKDMLYCKQQGIKEYDWGGISSFENPNGIDKYKMKFGVEFREYYTITCRVSLRAKAIYQVKRLLGKA